MFQLSPSGTNSAGIKSHNLSAILLTLLYNENVSRVHLAQLLGVSTTTITNLVSELLEKGIVIEEGLVHIEGPPNVGRPQKALRLIPDARFGIGAHIDVDTIRVAITDIFAQPAIISTCPLDLQQSANQTLIQIEDLTRNAIRESGIDPERIVGMGVGMSGLVDPERGINVVAPNLGWRNVHVKERFSASLGIPISVDNGVRAMALGEFMYGVKASVYALAFVYARVGVGSGFVVGGQIYRGSGAGAGEIGHTTIIPDGGERCRCGNQGCLETLVSEPAIIRLARKIARKYPEGLLAIYLAEAKDRDSAFVIRQIFAAARAGDEDVRAMLDERARYMGIALANLINIMNPEMIVLGGLFAEGKDLLLPQVEATMRERAFANLGEKVRLTATGFDENAGVIGAAALALDSFFFRQTEAGRDRFKSLRMTL